MKTTKDMPKTQPPALTTPKEKSFWGKLFKFSPKGTKYKWLKNILRVLMYLALAVIVAMIVAFIYFSKDLPSPGNIDKRHVPQSTRIMDRNGEVLYEIHGDENRTVVDINTLPDYVKMASVAIEDDSFYKHPGFDVKGIVRAVLVDVIGGTPSQGGSTITQQFVKNSILTSEKKLTRKIKELILAVEIEWMYSKDEILGMYLNEIPYGSSAYGIEAAANTFFGKNAKDLTVAEAATLASLPNAPSYYSPYGSHPDDLLIRRDKTLKRMADLGHITPEQKDEALNTEMVFDQKRFDIKAPHFVFYVKEQLEEMYGESFVEQGGLQVYTTLDMGLQNKAEKAINDNLGNIQSYGANNAALTSIDPRTGQILAMVGSVDYFDMENDGNVNVANNERQPGSSFKPFAYATAFKKGYGPNTLLFDVETDFGNGYKPRNYDLSQHGPVKMRDALAQSLNTPAVKTLYLAGLEDTIDTAHEMGITTLNESMDHYGLALVLGGGEVKLVDEVAAYTVFADNGVKHDKTPFLKITENGGKVLYEYEDHPKQVLEPQVARLISDILSDQRARGGFNVNLNIDPYPVAAKTGTTQEYRDAWTVGYTPTLAAGVWVGNNDNTPMQTGGAGLIVASPIWQQFMRDAMDGREIENFTAPEPVQEPKPVLAGQMANEVEVEICNPTKKLATKDCPSNLREKVKFRKVHNILFYVKKDDPLGDYPKNPQEDPQFNPWEIAVRAWAAANNYNESDPPTEEDDSHTADKKPQISIYSPDSGGTITDQLLTITTKIKSAYPLAEVGYYFDDTRLCTITAEPFTTCTYRLNSTVKAGYHTLRVVAVDEIENGNEVSIKVNVDIAEAPKKQEESTSKP